MSNDFSLKKIFDFFIETFDLNLGKATKFKTDFSRDKYIEPYKLMKSNYKFIFIIVILFFISCTTKIIRQENNDVTLDLES